MKTECRKSAIIYFVLEKEAGVVFCRKEVSAIGPALETFIQALLIVLAVVAALGFVTRPLWRRLYRYLKAWHLHDLEREEEQKRETANRRKAEAELREFCHEDEVLPRQQVRRERED